MLAFLLFVFCRIHPPVDKQHLTAQVSHSQNNFLTIFQICGQVDRRRASHPDACRRYTIGSAQGYVMKYCIYCGDNATDRDHVMPISWKSGIRNYRKGTTVPSCKDCNRGILGSKPFFTVEARQEYVAKILRKRLLRALSRYGGDDMPQHIAQLAIRADFALGLVVRIKCHV